MWCRGNIPPRREPLWTARSQRPQTSSPSRPLRPSPLGQEAASWLHTVPSCARAGLPLSGADTQPIDACIWVFRLNFSIHPHRAGTQPGQGQVAVCSNKLASPRVQRLGGKLDLALCLHPPQPGHSPLRLTLKGAPTKQIRLSIPVSEGVSVSLLTLVILRGFENWHGVQITQGVRTLEAESLIT